MLLKGTRFQDTDEIRTNATKALLVIAKSDFSQWFQQWKGRWANWIESQGAYFEWESSSSSVSIRVDFLGTKVGYFLMRPRMFSRVWWKIRCDENWSPWHSVQPVLDWKGGIKSPPPIFLNICQINGAIRIELSVPFITVPFICYLIIASLFHCDLVCTSSMDGECYDVTLFSFIWTNGLSIQ